MSIRHRVFLAFVALAVIGVPSFAITNDWAVVCGMAMGYADPDALVNTFQPPRIALEDYAVFLD